MYHIIHSLEVKLSICLGNNYENKPQLLYDNNFLERAYRPVIATRSQYGSPLDTNLHISWKQCCRLKHIKYTHNKMSILILQMT